MGGHGGLNILPQKRWNVYRFDNREKVRKDEEEAAKEEQLKREQSHKRDTEFRIEQLRQARGLASGSASTSHQSATAAPEIKPSPEGESKSESKHINLFEGIRIFDPIGIKSDDKKNNKRELSRDDKREFKRMKKEAETPKVVSPEDEKYRLGYGVAGKGVKLPWYMEKQPPESPAKEVDSEKMTKSSNIRKKSVEELREERLKREGKEKERERALLMKHKGNDRRGYSYSTRR